MSTGDRREFESILGDIERDGRVQEMKRFVQHGGISTYEHCRRVAELSYSINKKLGLRSDKDVLLKGAMLHDFHLYDWHKWDGGAHWSHGFSHAGIAMRNARDMLGVDEKTQDVIRCHMWPLNLTSVPRSREAWIVCCADKISAVYEALFLRGNGDGGM